jgi:hypothetical protein
MAQFELCNDLVNVFFDVFLQLGRILGADTNLVQLSFHGCSDGFAVLEGLEKVIVHF